MLLAQSVGVDRRHFKTGVSHPFGQHVERNVFADGVDAVAVAESLGSFMRPVLDLGRVHHFQYSPPCRDAAPRPERFHLLLPLLAFPQPVHHCQEVKRGIGHRHGAEHPACPFLERLEHHGLAGEVHPIRSERQGFRHPAPGVMQDHTQGAYFPREVLRGHQKRRSFRCREIEAMAFGIV